MNKIERCSVFLIFLTALWLLYVVFRIYYPIDKSYKSSLKEKTEKSEVLASMVNMCYSTRKVSASVASETIYYGLASYYSREGCIGCSPDLRMANGEILDDSKLTVAFNRCRLNKMVEVENTNNGQKILAKVSDTGGFERHGRIIDLSVAVKNAINCRDLCKVKVKILE